MRKTMIRMEQGIEEGEDLDFSEGQFLDGWLEYNCSDGAKVRVKVLVAKIVKLNRKNEDGNIIYIVKSNTFVDTKNSDKENCVSA